MEDVYKLLAQKLDGLPNGFPPTESGVELRILKKIFTPEEAEMLIKLKPIPEPAEAIAERLGKPIAEIQGMLDIMVHKGEIASMKMFGAQVYVVVPFIVGIYEFQLDRMDKELAELIEEYAPALMNTLGGFSPALTRVIPISRVIEGDHQVLRHEDVEAIFKKAKSFQLMDCICRKERKLQGHECSHESETCLAFSNQEDAFERTPRGRKIDKEQALAVIKKCEEAGLVHTTYNVQSGQMFMCNCCSCCCGLLRGMSAFKAPHLMAKSNFTAMVDPETCIGCGVCADERCPVKAIEPDSDKFKVNPDRCIGCGVCLPTCPVEAIQLVRKPEEGVELPPENLMDWYFKRAESRGIKIIV